MCWYVHTVLPSPSVQCGQYHAMCRPDTTHMVNVPSVNVNACQGCRQTRAATMAQSHMPRSFTYNTTTQHQVLGSSAHQQGGFAAANNRKPVVVAA